MSPTLCMCSASSYTEPRTREVDNGQRQVLLPTASRTYMTFTVGLQPQRLVVSITATHCSQGLEFGPKRWSGYWPHAVLAIQLQLSSTDTRRFYCFDFQCYCSFNLDKMTLILEPAWHKQTYSTNVSLHNRITKITFLKLSPSSRPTGTERIKQTWLNTTSHSWQWCGLGLVHPCLVGVNVAIPVKANKHVYKLTLNPHKRLRFVGLKAVEPQLLRLAPTLFIFTCKSISQDFVMTEFHSKLTL